MKYSKHGYKRNSKDVNNSYNVIGSGNITMEGVDFPVIGTDNLGNQELMMPGANYTFPGTSVFEIPLQNFPKHFQQGGSLPIAQIGYGNTVRSRRRNNLSNAIKKPEFKRSYGPSINSTLTENLQSIGDDVSKSFNAFVNPTLINNNKLNLRAAFNADPGIGWDGSNKQFSDFGTPTINPNFGGNIQADYKLGKNVNLSGGANFGTFVGDSPSTQPYWAGLNIKLKDGGEKKYQVEVIKYPLGYQNMPPGHIESRLLNIDDLPEKYKKLDKDGNPIYKPYLNAWISGNKKVRYDADDDYAPGVQTLILNLNESELENYMNTSQQSSRGEQTETWFGSIPTAIGGGPGDYDFIDNNCADQTCTAFGLDESAYTLAGITTPQQVFDALKDDPRLLAGSLKGNQTAIEGTAKAINGIANLYKTPWYMAKHAANKAGEGVDYIEDNTDFQFDWEGVKNTPGYIYDNALEPTGEFIEDVYEGVRDSKYNPLNWFEAGGSLPQFQNLGEVYIDGQWNLGDVTEEKTLRQNFATALKDVEYSVDDYLGNPSGTALSTFPGSDNTHDGKRHAYASALTADKVGFGMSNILGLAHEIGTKNIGSEHLRDIGNNFIGSVVGSIPFTDQEDHLKITEWLSDKGLLFDKSIYDKYKDGGSLPKAQYSYPDVIPADNTRVDIPQTNITIPKSNISSEDNGWSFSDWGHGILDAAGLWPGVGEVADGVNALWYAAEGDKTNAALSAAAMIPFFGWGATAAKTSNKINKAVKATDATTDVIKNVTPTWSKGVTHYGDAGVEGIQGALTGMKNTGKTLDNMNFDASSLINKNVINHGSVHGRQVVEVALPNGQTQLFYKSSGLAGKSGKGVAGTTEGLWQPFGGHATTNIGGNNIDNWFIKDAGYENFYGSNSFRDISGNLDRIAAEEGWDMSEQLLKSNVKQTGGSIDFNSLQKGIKWVESLNGKLMKNKQSSASGYYGQLFDEIEYDGTRDEFIADTDFQNELFRKRAHGEITNVPGLIDNGTALFEEYKDVNHGLTKLEIAGLSNMLGRQGTRKYLGNVIRDGKTLAEVFPNLYGANVNQANKTPDEYIQKFNEGLAKESKGGEFLNKVKRLNQQLKIFNSGGKISSVAKQELINLNMIKPKMQKGGAVQQKSYVTKRGDNLSRIASNNNLTLSELLKYNPRYLSNPSDIGIGETIQLSNAPIQNNNTPNMVYEIKSGDTLSKIASEYGVRYQDIATLNNINDPSKIMPGQNIRLPDNATASGPNVVAQQNRANSVYIPSQSNVVVNANTNANEVWAKRKLVNGKWITEGKSAIIDEINKDSQANRIIRGMNDIAESQTINYTIKGGDMLSKIARENGITTQQLIDDNNISDPTKIQPGQEIKINKSTGKPYIIVDEKAGRMHLYYPGQNEPLKSYPIIPGLAEGDQQTKTVIQFFKDGEKLEQDAINKLMEDNDFKEVGQITSLPGYTSETQWDLGNKSTGAGVYTIDAVNKETNYTGNASSFVLANQAGNRPGTVIHSTPSASMTGRLDALDKGLSGDESRALGVGTNGCINGTCSAMTELYENPDIGEGTQVFVLPEDNGNNFVYENGKINFYTKAANDEESKTYETQSGEVMQNPLGLNETPGSQQGNYKPINITFDKNYFQNNSDRYDGLAAGEEQEFNDATKPFLNSLADNKKKLMDKLGMDGDTYNDLAIIAFGIYGYESGMGDTNSIAENIVKGGTKAAGWQQTNPDVQSKQNYQNIKNWYTGNDGDWDSTGYTQAKWEYIEKNPEAKATLAKLGINKDNYTEWTMDPAKNAEFTIARLYDFHQKTQASINKRNQDRKDGTFVKGDDYNFDPVEKYGEEEEVYDPWIQLPNQWSPTSPGYADFVNKYTDYITLTETDVDDLDNNLIIKGEYTDDNPESRKRIQANKGWEEKLLNLPETIEFARLDARDAIDDATGGAASYIGEVYDNTLEAVDDAWVEGRDAVVNTVSNTASNIADAADDAWVSTRDAVTDFFSWKLGGEFGIRNQVQFYDDYISGVYKNTKQENKANKLYDKLNRMYYNDSKKSGKSQIDVMRSILHSNR